MILLVASCLGNRLGGPLGSSKDSLQTHCAGLLPVSGRRPPQDPSQHRSFWGFESPFKNKALVSFRSFHENCDCHRITHSSANRGRFLFLLSLSRQSLQRMRIGNEKIVLTSSRTKYVSYYFLHYSSNFTYLPTVKNRV